MLQGVVHQEAILPSDTTMKLERQKMKILTTKGDSTAYLKSLAAKISAAIILTMNANAATPYVMSGGNYSEGFSDIANWTNNFASGTGTAPWSSVGINTTGTSVTSGVRTTKSSATFSATTSGGVQKGTGNLVFLSTGSSATPEAVAADLLLDFTGRTAGTLSFDWSAIDNSSGTRPTSLRVFWSTDGSTFTEIAGAQLLDKLSSDSGSITNVALPSNFDNSATARLRFYNHAGTITGAGSRDKIAIDNLSITSTGAPILTLPTSPADNAIAVDINTNLVATFNVAMQKGTTGNITIKKTSDASIEETIDITSSAVTIVGAVVTIDPSVTLAYSTEYYVTIDADALKDTATITNNYGGLSSTTAWSFTTVGAVADTTPPTMTPTTPADNATNIALNSNLVATFDETVQKGTGNVYIKKSTDDTLVQQIDIATAAVTINGAIVTIDPPNDLAYDTEYYVTIDSGAIKDLASAPNNYAGLSDKTLWNFKSIADTAPPTLLTVNPTDNSTNVPVVANLVATFSESVQKGTGFITIKKTSDDSVVQQIDVTTAAVTILDAVVTIDPPSDLTPGTGYYVTIDLGAIKDSATTPNNYDGLSDKTLWNFYSIPAAITPGQVVISQVYGGGGNAGATYTHDFIELHNNSNSPIDITGWSVQYASSSGSFGAKTDLIGNIPAGGYFLVQGASTAAVGAALPTPDIIGTLSLSGTNGKVALIGNNTLLASGGPASATISDFVGYGTATLFEGSAAAPTASNSLAVVRQNSGTLDTNVNSFDFITAVPAPRNSTTPAYNAPIDGSGLATLANLTPASPFLNSSVFGSNLASQTVAITLSGTFPNSTLSEITIDVPTAFTGLAIGNVSLAGTGSASVTGNTITISGAALTTANTLTITIGGLQSPNTFSPVDLTNDGNYAFVVATKQSGGTLTPLSASPKAYVVIPIANIRDQDANGVPLDLNDKVAVQGVCTEEDFLSGASNTSAYLQEVSGSGVNIFSNSVNSPYVLGKEYVTFGNVIQFNGLTEVTFTSLSASVFDLGVATATPTPITLTLATLMADPASYEGKLITIAGLTPTSAVGWPVVTSIPVTDDGGTTTLDIYIQSGSSAITSPFFPAAITGIFGQFDNSSPFTEGYQLQPRSPSDIVSSGLSPFQTWATGAPYNLTGNDALFNADPDKDGVSNGIEFIVGSSPIVANDANDFIPKVTITGAPGARVATIVYRRTDASSYLNPVLQTSPDLLTWSEPIEGFNGASIVVDNDFYGTSPGIDKVTVTLDANGPRGFVRLIATSYP
jgi:methionine-rich copper-binding protein CopC